MQNGLMQNQGIHNISFPSFWKSQIGNFKLVQYKEQAFVSVKGVSFLKKQKNYL